MQRVATSVPDVEQYRPLVKQIALQVASGIPRHVELDELVSAGTLGLVEAARRFDPIRGVRFETYVTDRIRGAIIDFLRSLDWAPRSLRTSGKRIEEARVHLTTELGRCPTETELAAEAGVTTEQCRSVRDSLSRSTVLTLDRVALDGGDDDAEAIVAQIADAESPCPDEELERKELHGYLADAVNCLPEQGRTVIALYYVEGMHMADIGELLGVTQSRASQIHSAALGMLRSAISAQLDPEQPAEVQNPKGRRAQRLSHFLDSVAHASEWRDRLDPEHKAINLSFESLVAELEDRNEMSTEEFAAAATTRNVSEADARRWRTIVTKAREISDRQEQAPSERHVCS